MINKSFFTDYTNVYGENTPFHEDVGYPKLVTVKPTLKCIAHCKWCEGRLKNTIGTKQLDLRDYELLFRDLSNLGTKTICISGGEPLLYENIGKVVSLAKQQGMEVSLNTNGYLLKKDIVEDVVRNGVTKLNLSIDSPHVDIHNKLRGLNGLLQRIQENIKNLSVEIRNQLEINVRMILSKYNYRDIGNMMDLCLNLGADSLSIDMIENDFKQKEFLLNEKEIQEFVTDIKPLLIQKISHIPFSSAGDRELATKQIISMFDTSFNSIENYANGIYRPDEKIKDKCTIPHSFMIIEGDGSVLPCNAVEYTRSPIVGNVLDLSIKDIRTGQNWDFFRHNKMDFCVFCPMNMSYTINFINKSNQ